MPGVRVTTNFFLVLTLVANGAVAGLLLLALGAIVVRPARAALRTVVSAVGPSALLLAWIVAVVTTLGSLYYSEHAGFAPCTLCWYQRIVMYPLVVVLGVAWLRRDRAGWLTAAPLVVIGVPLSLYHWLVERVPSLAEGTSCSLDAPCSAPWFEKLGYVTLAWMCMSSFLLIGALLACSAASSPVSAAARDDDALTTVSR